MCLQKIRNDWHTLPQVSRPFVDEDALRKAHGIGPLGFKLPEPKAKPFKKNLIFTASLPKPPSAPRRGRLNRQGGPIRLTVIPFRP